jgi:hypothetical protein
MSSSIVGGNAKANMGAGLIANAGAGLIVSAENFWKFICMRRPKGCDCKGCQLWRKLPEYLHESADIFCRNAFPAWEEAIANLVTTEGKNDLLTNYLKGSSYTAAFYVGLVDNASFGAYAAGDTAAKICASGAVNSPTTNNWAEGTPYSNANRVTWTGGTASAGSIDNSGAVAAFNINATLTVRGGFLDTNNVKNGTSGKIYGEADFGASRSVLSGDTLNVTVTCTV